MAVERRERELQRAEEEMVEARRRSEENLQRLQEMDRRREQQLKEQVLYYFMVCRSIIGQYLIT